MATDSKLALRCHAEVRARLDALRVRQREVAALLGLSQNAVSRRYTGDVPWRLDELEALAAHLDVPVSALIEEAA